MNVYDVRRKCEGPLCYRRFEVLDDYLNRPSTRAALGVGNRTWAACNMGVHADMQADWCVGRAGRGSGGSEREGTGVCLKGRGSAKCMMRRLMCCLTHTHGDGAPASWPTRATVLVLCQEPGLR